jgi:cell division protein FtsI (penicillin-binding protein 3)
MTLCHTWPKPKNDKQKTLLGGYVRMVYRSKNLHDDFFLRQPQSLWTKTAKRRGATAFLIGMSFWLLIISRLFYFQVLKEEEYKKIALKQHQLSRELEAKRGLIYDRNGQLLTVNLPAESFFAIPESVKNINTVASLPYGASGPAFRKLVRTLKTDSNFVWLKRKVDKKEGERIKSRLAREKIEGVYVLNETKRYYLDEGVGKDILGFTNIDNRGLAGVELQYNQKLSGKNGEATLQRDGHRDYYQLTEYPIQEPKSGKNLVLTIDMELQSIVEEELTKGANLTGADGGSAVFMDPKSGEILALTNFRKKDGLPIKNGVISDNFEPGSTFKIVTAASALEEKILGPQDLIFAGNGKFKIAGRFVHDVKSYDWLTFRESVILSSNIALAQIATMVGKERIYKYVRNFGFGSKTKIDLPGESKGFISSPPEDWPDFVLCTIGFGQGISVTALQLVCAYAAVANDGILMKPFVVKAITDENGDTLKTFLPTQVRRVISSKTASTLVEFLKGVVSYGTGKNAKLEEVEIGGKTGTAQKAKPNERGYESNKYIASFVGFFPADDAKIVGLITLDNPKTAHLGGQTAAPIFKNTTLRILARAEEPFMEGEEKNSSQLASCQEGSDDSSTWCSSPAPKDSSLVLKSPSPTGESLSVPNVVGMTAREAVKVLSAQNLQVKLKGSGLVTKLSLESGLPSDDKQICVIECSPR